MSTAEQRAGEQDALMLAGQVIGHGSTPKRIRDSTARHQRSGSLRRRSCGEVYPKGAAVAVQFQHVTGRRRPAAIYQSGIRWESSRSRGGHCAHMCSQLSLTLNDAGFARYDMNGRQFIARVRKWAYRRYR